MTFYFFADSFTNPAKPAESNNRQPYWPHIKRRPKNRADQQMDFCLFLLCFRIYSCHCFVAASHWLASIDGSSVSSGDDSLCLDNLIYMCWAARGNCWGIGQAPFVNEWARDWYTCSKNACVGRILSRKSEGYEKVRIVTLCSFTLYRIPDCFSCRQKSNPVYSMNSNDVELEQVVHTCWTSCPSGFSGSLMLLTFITRITFAKMSGSVFGLFLIRS